MAIARGNESKEAQEFKRYIGVKQLVSELKKEGTRNDKRLKNIFKKIINN